MFLGPCPSRRHFSDKSRAKVPEKFLASYSQQGKAAGVTWGCFSVSYKGSACSALLAESSWGKCHFPRVPFAFLWPDSAQGCSLSSRRRSAIPLSYWSSKQPLGLPAILVALVIPEDAAEWRVVPWWIPAGQKDMVLCSVWLPPESK